MATPLKAPQPATKKTSEEVSLLRFLDRLDSESQAARKTLDESRWPKNLDLYRGRTSDANAKFEANIISTTVERKAALFTETKPSS